MESCERYIELLSAHLDGPLSDQEERELEEHLAACPACRALESQLAAIHAAFPELEEVPAPEGFAQGVMDRIRAEEAPNKKVIPLFRRPQVRALAGLAACAVLCVGLYQTGVFSGNKNAVYDEIAAVSPAGESLDEMTADLRIAPASVEGMEGALSEEEAGLKGGQDSITPFSGVQAESVPQYEVAGRTVDAVLTLTQLPEGAEKVLGPETETVLDGEGQTCYLVTWEQMETLLALIREQDGITSSMTTPWGNGGLCAVVLAGEQ